MMARSLPRRDSGLEAYATRKRRVPKAYPAKRRGRRSKGLRLNRCGGVERLVVGFDVAVQFGVCLLLLLVVVGGGW